MYNVYTVSGACGGPMSRVLPLWQVDCEAAAHLNGSHFFWVHGAARDAASLEANIVSRQFPSILKGSSGSRAEQCVLEVGAGAQLVEGCTMDAQF